MAAFDLILLFFVFGLALYSRQDDKRLRGQEREIKQLRTKIQQLEMRVNLDQ